MSEAKFTKGEWIKSHYGSGVVFVTHEDMRRNTGHSICTLSGSDKIANAHLIAAAPEMYAMLDAAISYMDGDSVEGFTYHYQEIKQLLAKARGE